jgi:hypothetical protein
MGWLGGAYKAVTGFFTGAGGGKIIDAADELYYSEEERNADDTVALADARKPLAPSHGTWFDSLIDGYNRLPRPAFATWAFGELVGWWNVDLSRISPEKMSLIIVIVTFYFAGRALLKDLPKIVAAFRALKS